MSGSGAEGDSDTIRGSILTMAEKTAAQTAAEEAPAPARESRRYSVGRDVRQTPQREAARLRRAERQEDLRRPPQTLVRSRRRSALEVRPGGRSVTLRAVPDSLPAERVRNAANRHRWPIRLVIPKTLSGILVNRLYGPRVARGLRRAIAHRRARQTALYPRHSSPHVPGKLWTMRQFAGYGSPAKTNARFRYLLRQGQTGLSVAFDLPTLMATTPTTRSRPARSASAASPSLPSPTWRNCSPESPWAK